MSSCLDRGWHYTAFLVLSFSSRLPTLTIWFNVWLDLLFVPLKECECECNITNNTNRMMKVLKCTLPLPVKQILCPQIQR